MELWLMEVKRVREDMEVAGLSERWRGKSVCVCKGVTWMIIFLGKSGQDWGPLKKSYLGANSSKKYETIWAYC